MIAQDGPTSNPTRTPNLISTPVQERSRVCGTGPESLPQGDFPVREQIQILAHVTPQTVPVQLLLLVGISHHARVRHSRAR